MNPQLTDSPRRILFGPFEFDSGSGELRKHGVRLRLQGQPLQILHALVSQPGEVVSRDDFQRQLWTGSTFVDFDHGLNAAMNRLRQTLGDSPDQPRYVQTLPGRGYRFIAAVQDSAREPVQVSTAPETDCINEPLPMPPTGPPPKIRLSRLWLPLVAMALGLLGGFLAARPPRSPANTRLMRFTVLPPEGYALEAGSSRQTFALSPDGDRLAYTSMDASGVFQTFIRDLDGIKSRALPNSRGSYTVFWAPDGRSLFMTVAGALRRSALIDESYQVICDIPPLTLTGALLGSDVLISGRSANFVVPASGGTPRAIEGIYQWPQILPDGKHIVYTAFDSKLGRHRAGVVEFGAPATAKNLLETDSRVMYSPSSSQPGAGYLLYVRAGNLLAHPFDPRTLRVTGEPFTVVSRIYSFLPSGAADFSVSNNGLLAYKRYVSRSQLAWVNRHGEVVSKIGPANVNLKQARLSFDGKNIATSIFDVNRGVNDIWIIDARTGATRRAMMGPGLADNPVWAPDSAMLAFNRAYAGPPKLFVRGLGETDVDQPLPEDYFQVPRDWSNDGRFLAFTNTGVAQMDQGLNGDVWLIDMARSRKVIHLISTPFHEDNAAFSPDGRWLAFTSDESGRTEVYVQAFDGGDTPKLVGARHLVSRQGAICLRWRRDGKELFYLAWDGKVYSVPIALSPTLSVSDPTPLFSISTEARAAIHSMAGFDVSADGLRFLIPFIESPEKSEVVIVQNWEALLQRNGKAD